MVSSHISLRIIERLSLYRRVLEERVRGRQPTIYSHSLAALVNVSPSLVRRDIMGLGCTGSPTSGYRVDELIDAIRAVVDSADPQAVVLVGLGKLGSALIDYFRGRRSSIRIVAAFDTSPDKVDRIYLGVRCYPMRDLRAVVAEQHAVAGIVAVPGTAAQAVAEELVLAGVQGILNFAPCVLHVPATVAVEAIDLTTSLEKVLFQVRRHARPPLT